MRLTFNVSLLGLLLPVLLNGQEVGLLRKDPDHRVSKIQAAVWGGAEQGWFRPSYAPVFEWSAGARAKGVRHGKNTTWMGLVSFEQKTGYNMLSSMFLEPGYFPVDLLEFTPGTKSRETGRLEAGFLTDLGYEWAAGLKASFQAAYAGKPTNLRHTTFGMDLQVEPTVTYVMDDDMGLASSYVFRLRTESLKAQPSVADGDLPLFLDMGMRYGTFQDGAGVFPVQEMSHGFSERFYSEDVSAGLKWMWKRGQARSSSFGNFRFPGSSVSVFYEQTFQADKTDHWIRLAYQRERDQLRQASTGGSGFTALSDRLGRVVELKYEARFLHGAVKSLGVALEGRRHVDRAAVSSWDQTKRNLGTATLSSAFAFGGFDMKLDAFAGGGLWRDRGRSRSETEDTPDRRTTDWLQIMDYQIAPRVGAGGSLAYHFSRGRGLFVQVDGLWCHALRMAASGGQDRFGGTLTIGYDF
jgi:hypothetical protein